MSSVFIGIIGVILFVGLLDWIDWVIAGGKSGPGARPMRIECAREVRATSTPARVSRSSSCNGRDQADVRWPRAGRARVERDAGNSNRVAGLTADGLRHNLHRRWGLRAVDLAPVIMVRGDDE